jgi:lipid II:glycine glycyltransferase (peptidoglycan interpeptide bridge formation enzyme)
LGLPLLRYGLYKNSRLSKAFQLTLHKIPFSNQYVGYLPKGPLPDAQLAQALKEIGRTHSCAFIKLEPYVLSSTPPFSVSPSFQPSPKPLFTKYNFILDLTSKEEDLLKNMHPKTRYNIRLAQKKGVWVEERVDADAFKIYLKLYFQTTRRQDYFGHNKNYQQKVWQSLKQAGMARVLIAFYKPEKASQPIPLACWMLLNFKDTLYYPYGGSSTLYKEAMASSLIAWEAIKLGKRLKLKKFDMWGALGPIPNTKDPWYGFHRFKAGFGGKLVEYLGTYDLVFNDPIYWTFTLVDKFTKLNVVLLKLLGK